MRIVSNALRDSARGRDCTLRFDGVCNYDPATAVLAHVPCGARGMGMKGPDTVACFACSSCHDALDGRTRYAVDWRDVLRAIAETHQIWVSEGLIEVKA